MVSVDYDAIAADYDRRYAVNDYSQVQEALLAFVGDLPGGRALEVGCGTGHWLRVLIDAGMRAAGVDASFNMLQHARRKTDRAPLVHARAEALPWRERSVDRLFCVNALHHFGDRRAFFAEARRVLVPGGRLLTIGLDPHPGVDRWYIYDYFAPVLEMDRRRYPSTADVRAELRDAGFVDVHTREVQHLPVRLSARDALDSGRLARSMTSQLSLLSDEQYEGGLQLLHQALAGAAARGETPQLIADLRLCGTDATAPH